MARPLSQAEWDRRARECGYEWLEPVAYANTPTLARCLDPACRYEWKARGSGYQRRSGCPKCAGKLPVPLEVREAQAAAVGAVWLEEPTNAAAYRLLRCKECQHEWKAPPTRVAQGHGCDKCAHRARGKADRKPQAEWREIAAAAGLEFLTDEVIGTERCRARCLAPDCRYEWTVLPHKVRGGTGCPKCGYVRTGKAQRLNPEEWDRAAAAAGVEWLEPVETGRAKVRARCLNCGVEWNAIPATLRRGSGCPSCAQIGFDPAAPAYLYLMVKTDGTAKVGISGVGKAYKARMGQHAYKGYRPVARWRLDPGETARAIEAAVLARWRNEDGLPPAAPEGEDGYTETVNTALLPLSEIRARIDALVLEHSA